LPLSAGIEEVTRGLDGAPMNRSEWSPRSRTVDRGADFSNIQNDLVEMQRVQRHVQVFERRLDRADEVPIVRYGVTQIRKGPVWLTQRLLPAPPASASCQRHLNEAGFDIEASVSKARDASGVSIVDLVRMKDEDLTGASCVAMSLYIEMTARPGA